MKSVVIKNTGIPVPLARIIMLYIAPVEARTGSVFPALASPYITIGFQKCLKQSTVFKECSVFLEHD